MKVQLLHMTVIITFDIVPLAWRCLTEPVEAPFSFRIEVPACGATRGVIQRLQRIHLHVAHPAERHPNRVGGHTAHTKVGELGTF